MSHHCQPYTTETSARCGVDIILNTYTERMHQTQKKREKKMKEFFFKTIKNSIN